MGLKLYNAFRDILNMPYFRNYQAVSGSVHNLASHEDAVAQVFSNNGFHTEPVKFNKKMRDQWLEHGDNADCIPNNTYIEQPCGTHDSPDFVVREDNRLYMIECKSSKKPCPTYNGGLPKSGYVYVFTCEKYNATTVYLSDDVVSPQVRDTYTEMVSEIEDIVSRFRNKLIDVDEFERGFDYFNREMYTQSGGKQKTDYFGHADRNFCEQNVLDFVRD